MFGHVETQDIFRLMPHKILERMWIETWGVANLVVHISQIVVQNKSTKNKRPCLKRLLPVEEALRGLSEARRVEIHGPCPVTYHKLEFLFNEYHYSEHGSTAFHLCDFTFGTQEYLSADVLFIRIINYVTIIYCVYAFFPQEFVFLINIYLTDILPFNLDC